MHISESQSKMPNWPKIDFFFFLKYEGWLEEFWSRERERGSKTWNEAERERAILSLLIYIFHEKSIPILTQRGNAEKISLPGSKALMCLITKDLYLPQNWKWTKCLLQGITPSQTFWHWKFAILNQICIYLYIYAYVYIYICIYIVIYA